jgi:hypothetical protein
LGAERKDRVVYDDHVLEVSILEYSEILYVNIVRGLDAVLPVNPVLDEGFCWVDIVEDCIRVPFVTGSEYNNFEVFVNHF